MWFQNRLVCGLKRLCLQFATGSDCTLVGRYSLDIVPASEVESPGFVGSYEECQFLVDEIEQEERANNPHKDDG